MKKVGILTFTYGDNYGQRLQNLALQTILERLGFDAFTIPQVKPRHYKIVNGVRHQNFEKFDDSFVKYYGDTIGKYKIPRGLSTFDYFIVGSDQVWNDDYIDKNNMMQYIAPQDLKSFGLIPEIIGRLPVLTYLNPLDRDALRAILTEPKNSIIKQYIKLFDMDNIKLTFQDAVFEYIVDKAVEYKLGARGLRSIVETIMMDVMFEIPSENKKTYEVTLEYAKSQLEKANMARLQTA